MPNFVNFNKSDEHCRICPACRKIRDELAPYKQMFEITGQFTRKKSKKKIPNSKKKLNDSSNSPRYRQINAKQRKNWGDGSKIDEEEFSDYPDQNDDSKNNDIHHLNKSKIRNK